MARVAARRRGETRALGAAAGAILAGCLEALGEMGAHAEGLACRAQLTQCLAAVKALGTRSRSWRCFLRLEEGDIDAEIAAKSEDGRDVDEGMGDDDMDIGAGAELNEKGATPRICGARLWLKPLLSSAQGREDLLLFRGDHARRATPRRASGAGEGCGSRVRGAAARGWGGRAVEPAPPPSAAGPGTRAESFPTRAEPRQRALRASGLSAAPSPRRFVALIQQARAVVIADERDADLRTPTRTSTRDEDDEDKAKEAAATAALLEDRPDWFTAQIAEGQAATVAKYARNFLPILFNPLSRRPSDALCPARRWGASRKSPRLLRSADSLARSFVSSSRRRPMPRMRPMGSRRA